MTLKLAALGLAMGLIVETPAMAASDSVVVIAQAVMPPTGMEDAAKPNRLPSA
jgi:hypothetical protein